MALILLMVASGAYFARNVLIALGLHKSPVLRSSERYANIDDTYYGLPELLLSLGLLALFGSMVFMTYVSTRFPPYLIGMIILLLALLSYQFRDHIKAYPQIFLSFPRWYVELRERTTREERRRIAYMWLTLPHKTRLIYSANDHAFSLWADLIILGTVTQTVEDQEAKERLMWGTPPTDVGIWRVDRPDDKGG